MVPLVTRPVAPLPAVPLVLISYWYPLAGAGDGAVHDIVADVLVTALDVTSVGSRHDGVSESEMSST